MPGSNWRDVIREQKKKEHHHHLVYLLVLIVILAGVGVSYIYFKAPTQISSETCIEMLAQYDPAVKNMELNNNTVDDQTLLFNDQEEVRVSMLLLDGGVRDCELLENDKISFDADHVYQCEPGKYYYSTGEKGGFYFVLTKAVPKDDKKPVSRVKYFKNKDKYDTFVENLELNLKQNNCEEI